MVGPAGGVLVDLTYWLTDLLTYSLTDLLTCSPTDLGEGMVGPARGMLVDPGIPIPTGASEVHAIDDAATLRTHLLTVLTYLLTY